MLQKAGGLFQLLADADFGTTYGLKSTYYKSRTANVSSAGTLRLAQADTIGWRNAANDGNVSLSVASDILDFDGDGFTIAGVPVQSEITVSDTATINLTLAGVDLSGIIVADSITNAHINSAAAIAYSKLNLSGSIVNADVNAAAAIAYSKLALTGSIVNADVSASAAIAYSKLALTGTIVNADLSASAAIAFSKLATLSSANILVGSAGNVATSVAVTGDVTISNGGVTAVGTNKITNAMLAQVGTATFKGRTTAGTGNAEDLTATQATALLNTMVGDSGSGGTKGLVPAPTTGDATKFLSGAGTWTNPAGAGDVVGPASSVASEFVLFDGTTGKLIKSATGSGFVKSTSGVYSTVSSIVNADIDAAAAIAWSKMANLTNSRALVSDGSGDVTPATTTATEIGYVNGVTSAIQTQLDTKVTNPMTTGGDLIYGGASGVPTRLANGTAGQKPYSMGGTAAPTWASDARPTVQKFTSGTGTYNKNYTFQIASGSATAGDTYTNNAVTFTVHATVASATQVVMSGSGAPAASGTLTRASGSGDATLTFTMVKAPLFLKVRAVGGAGSGGGAASTNNGVATTFGSSLLTANGGTGGGANGAGGNAGGAGGSATVASPAVSLVNLTGGTGYAGFGISANSMGGGGAPSPFGGAGTGGTAGTNAIAAIANSGSGGGGGNTSGGTSCGGGGGAGGYLEAIIFAPSATYAYAVGGGGAATSGTGPTIGSAGGSGVIIVEEYYQ